MLEIVYIGLIGFEKKKRNTINWNIIIEGNHNINIKLLNYYIIRTTLRLQLSASGSKMKLCSFVNPISNINKKAIIVNIDKYCNQSVPPVPGWYDANVNRIRIIIIIICIFWRRLTMIDLTVLYFYRYYYYYY